MCPCLSGGVRLRHRLIGLRRLLGVLVGVYYAGSRPTRRETTPAASDSAPIQTSQMSRLGCWISPLPAEDTKNPADIRIAANGTPERAAQPAKPCSVVASASTWQMRPRLTRTPACAWPARANAFWKSVIGTLPRTIRVRNQPPYPIPTTGNRGMPAVVRLSLLNGTVRLPRTWHLDADKTPGSRPSCQRQDRVYPMAYHHGDLRRALLSAAIEAIGEHGPT